MVAMQSLDFYFDFGSPYAYFAALRIDALAARHDRAVCWRPFMLGSAFRKTGMAPLLQQPMRGDYARRDWVRLARRMGVPFVLRDDFPLVALAAARIFYWIAATNPDQARRYALRIFHAYFGQGRDMTRAEECAGEAVAVGIDPVQAIAAAKDPAWKEKLKIEGTLALARGVFGSPYFLVDDEPFWGNDRLDDLERWLETGGW